MTAEGFAELGAEYARLRREKDLLNARLKELNAAEAETERGILSLFESAGLDSVRLADGGTLSRRTTRHVSVDDIEKALGAMRAWLNEAAESGAPLVNASLFTKAVLQKDMIDWAEREAAEAGGPVSDAALAGALKDIGLKMYVKTAVSLTGARKGESA
jgi:hypothetical protein